jgi:hypothetical protein
MMTTKHDRIERLVARLAKELEFPPTPDLRPALAERMARPSGGSVGMGRLGWALAALGLALVATVALVPAARATLFEVIQVGVVRVLFGPTDQLPPGTRGQQPGPTAMAASLVDMAGETSLAWAAEQFPTPLRLPGYPAELGLPDRAYLQGDPVAARILIWLADDDPARVELALFELLPNVILSKFQPTVIDRTLVNGEPALWTEGPYPIETMSGGLVERRLIDGHVLIWAEDNLSYRLESDLPLEEAVRIAESLIAMP